MRTVSTGLATAYFRLFILDGLARSPARPNALLLQAGADGLPFASGAFSRAMQSLIESGHVEPAPHGAVRLTPAGAAERMAERERWRSVVPAVERIVGTSVAESPLVATLPEPVRPPPPAEERISDAYLDQVLVSELRERLARSREHGRPFVLVLGAIDLEHAAEAQRRAMIHRAIRATLGGRSTLFGGDVDAFRYGTTGVALLAPSAGDDDRAARLVAALRARLDELLRTMAASVRAFGGARWSIRTGAATWSPAIVTTRALLRLAQDELEGARLLAQTG